MLCFAAVMLVAEVVVSWVGVRALGEFVGDCVLELGSWSLEFSHPMESFNFSFEVFQSRNCGTLTHLSTPARRSRGKKKDSEQRTVEEKRRLESCDYCTYAREVNV